MDRGTRRKAVRRATTSLWLAGALLSGVSCGGDDIVDPTEPNTGQAALALASATTALPFSQLSAGGAHACGVTPDNRAYCSGLNRDGQLGNGTNTGPEICDDVNGPAPCSSKPVLVRGGRSFRQVSAGGSHTCGVTTDYRAYCWGANYAAQLGDGTTTLRLTPVAVAGGLRFRQVEAGFLYTCGVSYPGNRAYCWGANGLGQLGDGTTTSRPKPVAVVGGHLFHQVAVGAWHTCGVTTKNEAWCWGVNEFGQLGDSTNVGKRVRPSKVVGGRQFRQVDAGERHTCAVTTSSRAFCWGDGEQGQVGNGKRYLSYWPRAVSGGLSFSRVSAGRDHTCGEGTDNRAYCWGWNDGAIGDGTIDLALTPMAVTGGLLFAQVSAGGGYTCGRTPAYVAYCWGSNVRGQLGDGTTVDRTNPTAVVGPM
jgi:alpha-tubulin suppressor-like RCC1 family protein